jgi:hypothetical protein
MASTPHLIIKENYVIQRIMLDPEQSSEYVYPFDHDLMIEDAKQSVSIGDWYEEVEGLFYRPIGIPPDWPKELQPPAEPEPEEDEFFEG